jgi:hypothetical protein
MHAALSMSFSCAEQRKKQKLRISRNIISFIKKSNQQITWIVLNASNHHFVGYSLCNWVNLQEG